ncbi:MAG: SusC/RagA family TonB-linked outer membrane protein [Adhaeribacter sp.]
MRRVFTIIMLLLLVVGFREAWAQEKEVSGSVTDENNTGLPGVSVLVKGTTTGTATDASGNYRLRVPGNEAVLVFSFIGYISREVAVGNQTTINVSLATDSKQLNEVVVTALGISREARSLGYATQVVATEEITRNRQANVVNALQGKVAGAQISSTGGGPGQGASIRIRGINSIDHTRPNEPLFVIDGMLMDNSTNTFGGTGIELRGLSNRAADINPDDIESINVLKGGAATALYGLRGANGVVVITTKKGSGNGIRVNYTGTYGFENINKVPEVQTTYTAGALGVYTPIALAPAWGPTIAEAKAIDPDHPDKLYENYKRAFDTGHQFRNTVNFTGGTDAVKFYASLSHFDHQGMLPFTNYKNYAARLNTDIKLSDKVRTGFNMSFTNSGGERYNYDRFGESLAYFSGRWDVRDYVNPDGTQLWRGTNNPIYGAATNKLRDNVNRFLGGITIGYAPFKWLDLNYKVGLDTYTDNRVRTAPGPRGITGERLYDNGSGLVGEYNTNFRTFNSTFIATLNSKFGENLNATLRLGQDIYDRNVKNTGVEGTELTVFDWFVLSNAKVLTPIRPNTEKYRLMGLFGEATLDYKNFLFLSVTGRNDITSSLLKPNNSFFYPSVSLGYVFTENFDLPTFITYGKLRGSYAGIGKDALPYSTSTGYSPYIGATIGTIMNSNLPAGVTGFTRAALLGDPGLKPEFTNTYEGGLEMNFLDNRLGFDLTYYYSKSVDQIIQASISPATGYVRAAVNAGDMLNKGIELVMRGTPVKTPDFNWDINLNFSANRNKILSIREDLTQITYAEQFGYSGSTVTMKLIPGEAYGNIYGSHYLRYYGNETEDPLRIDYARPLVIGANGFPIRAPLASQKILGNTQPDWIGGITNTFTYKNLSLSGLVDARWGFEKYNQLENFYSAFGIADYTANRRETKVFEGVLADGTPNTKEVWLGQGTGPDGVAYGEGFYRNYHRNVSENFVQDASWIRLRSLTLAYSLPPAWLPRKFIRNASVSVTGNNLWLYTDYYGLDPESSSDNSGSNVDGFAGFTYPAARTILFTLNLGF